MSPKLVIILCVCAIKKESKSRTLLRNEEHLMWVDLLWCRLSVYYILGVLYYYDVTICPVWSSTSTSGTLASKRIERKKW